MDEPAHNAYVISITLWRSGPETLAELRGAMYEAANKVATEYGCVSPAVSIRQFRGGETDGAAQQTEGPPET